MRAQVLTDSSPHRRTRSPGAPEDSLAPSNYSVSPGSPSNDQEDEDASMTYADDEDEDDRESDGDDSVFFGQNHQPHNLFPQSSLPRFPSPFSSSHHHSYYAGQLARFDSDSDDTDMSDAGAPLVSHSAVANHSAGLNADVNMDHSYRPDDESSFSDDEELGEDGHGWDAAADSFHDISYAFAPLAVAASMWSITAPAPPAAPSSAPTINAEEVTQHLEQLVAAADDDQADWMDGHPTAMTNPHPNALGPGNYNLNDFLHHWAAHSRCLQGMARDRGRFPWPAKINAQLATPLTHVQYADLRGDLCDFQGLDWEDLGVSRKEARERRLITYNNFVNKTGSDRWHPSLPDAILPRSESYFRFRRMDIKRNVSLCHFQLRYILASPSRSRVFYPSGGGIHEFNPVSGEGRMAMKIGDGTVSQVSTLDCAHGVLAAGGFNGEYLIGRLDSDTDEPTACREGTVTSNISGITNHVQVHQLRSSSSPVAAFASNDMGFRVLDLTTEKWLAKETFDFPLNCTAMSPDRRLRVGVGDHYNVVITAAESTLGNGKPEILQELSGHRDFGFSCAWADDGWTVATGFQDKAVKIWDARRWTDSSGMALPVCTLRSEMAGVRGLRFSPVGSGKRVLVAAEEADYVNLIDAQTFATKQTVDIFGEIGGVAFANDGQDLMVLCCDRARGGLIQLERCGLGAEATWDLDEELLSPRDRRWRRGTSYDWRESMFTEEKRIKESATRRRRKGAVVDALEPF